jgi:hypothetical protein
MAVVSSLAYQPKVSGFVVNMQKCIMKKKVRVKKMMNDNDRLERYCSCLYSKNACSFLFKIVVLFCNVLFNSSLNFQIIRVDISCDLMPICCIFILTMMVNVRILCDTLFEKTVSSALGFRKQSVL